jgi:hypothetical protein
LKLFGGPVRTPHIDINLQKPHPNTLPAISRVNFAMAGGFMFSMLLSSIADEDINFWSNEISRYRRLLDMQSQSFDTTKLAAARMSALANVGQGGNSEHVSKGSVDPKQAFCSDFGVALNTL